MQFAQPIWLIAGLATCSLLVWNNRRYDKKQRVALSAFVSSHLVENLTRSVSTRRHVIKRAFFLAGVACLFVALARPQAGFRWEEARRKGLSILFAVDTSKSMLAQDVKPDRLTRAKLAVNDFVDKLDGDGVGLIAFAGSAFLQSPVTLDYDAFRESLNALDTGVIPRPGTDIASAISEAQAAFRTQPDHEKILVLVTDGEDLEGSAITAAQAAAKDGVKIFTVGVGNANGELIPVPSENGGTEFIKDESGQLVKSKLDETMLKKIADATGGMYQPLGQQGEGLTAIYQRGLSQFARHDLASRQHRVYIEQFHWPLLAALLCFAAEMLIGTRKRTARVTQTSEPAKAVRFAPRRRKLVPATAALAAILAMPALVQASPQSAEKAYQKGDFATAEKQYEAATAKAPEKPELQFNLASAAYKTGEYDKAADALQKGLKADQVKLQQDTYYNLGNTQYRLGQKTEKTDPQKTIQTWEQAVKSYETALQLKSDDADAKHNRDLVKKKLEELKKQQQQQNQDQKKDDQKNRDQKDKDQKSGSGSDDKEQKQDQKDKNQDQAKNGSDNKDKDQQNKDQQQKGGSGSDQKDQQKDQADKAQEDQGKDKQDQAKNGSDDKKQDQQSGQSGSEQKGQKQDQANKNQNGQDQNQQAGNQPQQSKPAQGKDQQANAGQKPDSSKPDGQDKAGEKPDKDGDQEQADTRREPGRMTREEAKNLLDALKGDDRQMPATQVARADTKTQDEKPRKDW